MLSVVLEPDLQLNLREIDPVEKLGPRDVRIGLRVVGVCGSDVHYYQHGRIGPFVVESPMVLGHEASGVVLEVGSEVDGLREGDRVCMEPGIPDPSSRASRVGMYNLDPAVRFWATPPVHGVLRPEVIHPADFTFKLPETVSFAEGAMVEPLAVGMHAAVKAQLRPGDVCVVLGAGPIGLVTALSALAGGAARVMVTDVKAAKLQLATELSPAIEAIDVSQADAAERVAVATDGWGADAVFECSGVPAVAAGALALIRPGGCVVYVGMPGEPVPYDVVAGQIKEARIEHVFRYAHVYPRALALMGSGQLDIKPLITDTFAFAESVAAFDFACAMPEASVKAQIVVAEE